MPAIRFAMPRITDTLRQHNQGPKMHHRIRHLIAVSLLLAGVSCTPDAPTTQQPDILSGPSLEIYFVGWDVLTRFRYSRDNVIRSAGTHLCHPGNKSSSELLGHIGRPATWRSSGEEGDMDLRLLFILRAEGMQDASLFADRFRICSDVTRTCRELDDEDRERLSELITDIEIGGAATCP